ncbi:putative 4-hydroxy-4-methyl-2-oxoglutarate aldolase [Vibrio hepatarius]|uniref:putative 4-hydroxy-4-methyl-2-oxoglutarate aldolase n=1 Tax=Vibrio hepatarius TaxID=171383 RepID=UPI001C0A2A1F|nr:putative 4-hydroxy-4-methyl-2-oxoglutarate aldolase [Vibrio hepatarius]MBU2897221.1 putative 4-hydroxy-4-methyl-2-oxoglutarate aldolase [Vibrio hepatarius]
MKDITPDICDKHEDKVTSLVIPLHTFGNKYSFWGEIVTVRCYHDNSKVIEMLSHNGKGKVLIIDGHGSCQEALFDGPLAILAINNDWEGVIIYGAIRDAGAMAEMEFGIKALGTSPFKADNNGSGEANMTLTIHNQMIQPGDYVYADWNGVVMSTELLDW